MVAESFRVRVADGRWLDAVAADPPDATPLVLYQCTPSANESGTKVTKLSFCARRSEALGSVWLGD
jgi:hypothetical protein